MEVFGGILLILLAIFIYLLPSWIGWNKRNVDAIIALNLFLGWTFIGWVIALIWALTNDPQPVNIIHNETSKPNQTTLKLDNLKKLKELFDTGAISLTEYNEEKSKILNKERPEELVKDWDFEKEKSAWDWLVSQFKK